jgi:hypothetical protein
MKCLARASGNMLYRATLTNLTLIMSGTSFSASKNAQWRILMHIHMYMGSIPRAYKFHYISYTWGGDGLLLDSYTEFGLEHIISCVHFIPPNFLEQRWRNFWDWVPKMHELRSSLFWGVSSVDWCTVADVSGQLTGPIFKCQVVQEDGTDRLPPNVGN